MREEYDLDKLRVKRRGPLPSFQGSSERPAKVRITIALDQDLVEHFKREAAQPGALPYQTQINQTLRNALARQATGSAEAVKTALLEDGGFLEDLAVKVREKFAA